MVSISRLAGQKEKPEPPSPQPSDELAKPNEVPTARRPDGLIGQGSFGFFVSGVSGDVQSDWTRNNTTGTVSATPLQARDLLGCCSTDRPALPDQPCLPWDHPYQLAQAGHGIASRDARDGRAPELRRHPSKGWNCPLRRSSLIACAHHMRRVRGAGRARGGPGAQAQTTPTRSSNTSSSQPVHMSHRITHLELSRIRRPGSTQSPPLTRRESQTGSTFPLT